MFFFYLLATDPGEVYTAMDRTPVTNLCGQFLPDLQVKRNKAQYNIIEHNKHITQQLLNTLFERIDLLYQLFCLLQMIY